MNFDAVFARAQASINAAVGASFTYSGLALRLETRRLRPGDPGFLPSGTAGNALDTDERAVVFSSADLATIARAGKAAPDVGAPVTFGGRVYRLDSRSVTDGGGLRFVASLAATSPPDASTDPQASKWVAADQT